MMRNANQRQIFGPKMLINHFPILHFSLPESVKQLFNIYADDVINSSSQEATNIPTKSHAAPSQHLPQRNTSQPPRTNSATSQLKSSATETSRCIR